MERFVADERTGLKYELVGDCYLIAGDDESETPQHSKLPDFIIAKTLSDIKEFM